MSCDDTRRGRVVAGAMRAAALSLGLALAPASAGESGRFAIDYEFSMAGFPLGQGKVSGRIDGGDYALDGSARLSGLAGFIMDFRAAGNATGAIRGRRHWPATFGAIAANGRREQTVRIRFAGDAVHAMEVRPSVSPAGEIGLVPVTRAHMAGVMDPMSALILPAEGPLGAATCARTLPIFNGRERFDVVLSHKSTTNVTASGAGYAGPVVVCKARYKAISGHRADRPDIRFFEKNQDIELWLAPLGGTDLVFLYRVTLPTPVGIGIVQASRVTAPGGPGGRQAALR